MKFVIAMMQHETNTFSPLPTDWSSFGHGIGQPEPVRDHAVVELFEGTETGVGAFIDIARECGAEFVTPIAAYAEPSGPVDQAAFDRIAEAICDAVTAGCDAVLLDLHGAMVSTAFDDGEGELLKRVRAVNATVPIGVALDFHTNLSEDMVSNATVITGYRTYPHIDIYETAERCGRTMLRMLRGEVTPAMTWGKLPLLTAMIKHTPAREPMKTPMDHARAAEADGTVLNASIFGGFPLADIPLVSLSTVIVTDGAGPEGPLLRDEILSDAWEGRAGFTFDPEPLAETIAKAKGLNGGPVVLADHGDNCGAGGAVDDMSVIAEALRQGLSGIVAGPICDPEALEAMCSAGIGNTVSISVGGKVPDPANGHQSNALELSGTVAAITDGRFILEGEMMAGFPIDLRGSAVLDTGPLKLVISGARVEPYATQFFTHIGIDPRESRYIILKSRQHFRAGFEPIAKHILLAKGAGVCLENYAEKQYRRLTRPIYPLDPETVWASQ